MYMYYDFFVFSSEIVLLVDPYHHISDSTLLCKTDFCLWQESAEGVCARSHSEHIQQTHERSAQV